MEKITALCEVLHPYADYHSPQLRKLFSEAMRENLQWHYQRNPFVAKWLQTSAAGVGTGGKDCEFGRDEEIPILPANLFKRHQLLSIPKEEIYLHLTSSGTSGEKSQVFFDQRSIQVAQQMVDRIFDYYGWITPDTPCDYLLYSYEPMNHSASVNKEANKEANNNAKNNANKLGTAYTDHFLCKYAPAVNVYYGIRHVGGDEYRFDWSGCIRAFMESANSGRPLRIFGFPAFLYFTLKRMRAMGIPPLTLHPDSLLFSVGGWKGHEGEAISKDELYTMCEEALAIPRQRLRDGFGSVEHCIPYIECENHKLHVPVWSRVFIRDLKTLEVLPAGVKGFLHFLSPYITSMPAMSVLMGDLASWYPADACACGVGTPYFEVHGRAGNSKSRSCAIAAAELLKGE